MNNQRRQLIVGVVGASVAFAALVFQLTILDPRTHDALFQIVTFGDKTYQGRGGPVWQARLETLGHAGAAAFYSGLLLMIAAALCWLLLPERESDGNDAA